MVGRTILQYQLGEKLGAGGMGEVYKALDTRLNRVVAIKVLSSAASADPEFRRRFIQEAQAASALNHPNIITIYDVVTDGDKQSMVMEYIDGKTLLELIPQGGLQLPEVIRYAAQIADGLGAAHDAGIVHRDIKPANVMINGRETVKLLDFGLAKLFESSDGDHSGDTTMLHNPLTVAGAIMGTANYMSPEQAEGRRLDARSDIFSFGTVLFEMVTGQRAFRGASAMSTISALLRDDIQPIRELRTGVPFGLEQIVVRCLQKDPGQRFQSMHEVSAALAALRPVADSSLYSPPTERTVVPAPESSARAASKAPLVAAALVLVAAIVGGGYWWTSRPHGPGPASSQLKADAVPVTRNPDAAPPPAPITTPVALGDGLPIRLTLSEDIASDAAPGAAVHLTVASNLRVDDSVVVSKGAVATGSVVDGAKRRILGMGGKMTLRLDSANAVNGQEITIRATPVQANDGSSKRPVINTGRKSKEVASPAGTEYMGYIDGLQTVQVKK